MKIVLLDDSEIGLILNKYILGEAFNTKGIVEFSEEAPLIEYLENNEDEPMVVLLDYYLVGSPVNGCDIFNKLSKKARKNNAFAIFSSGIEESAIKQCLKDGMHGYISKSLKANEIVEKVKLIKEKHKKQLTSS